MIKAMYSGISGLKADQEKLDVIGNNIANVNTTAYKDQRIRFEDTLSQNMSQATGATTMNGGTNPEQVGLGVKVAGIDTLTTAGGLQSTSRNLDFAIDAAGYFVVAKGTPDSVIALTGSPATAMDSASTTMSDIKYTRDGAFQLDSNGSLLTSNGYRVMGYSLKTDTESGPSVAYTSGSSTPTVTYVNGDDSTLTKTDDNLVPLVIPKTITDTNSGTTKDVVSYSVDSNGVIKAVLSDNSIAALGQIAMTSFNNDAGLSKVGNNLYSKTSNSGDAYFRTAVGESTSPNDSGFGNIDEGELEMSNVDLAEQFSDMIVASRAFQANGKIITTSDEILQTLVNLKNS
jgi:flagellar hook protein FlgE